MTTSLFDFLLETMPLAGARGALEANFNGGVKFENFANSDLRRVFRYLLPSEDYTAPIPPVGVDKFDDPQPTQGLWGWTHRAAEPAKITDVFCRVRDAEYAAYKVLDSLEWGLEDPVGNFKNVVRITNSSGLAIELPLSPRFVHWKWVAVAGYLPDDATDLWRLKALHDRSIVIAFVYDLDPTTGDPKPMRETARSDPDRAAELDKLEKVARELTPEGAKVGGGDEGGGGTLAQIDDMTWVGRIRQDKFMERGGAEGAVHGEVGEECKATAGAPRVLVTLCLTVARERADFEPGGVIGVARLYPHVMVWANIPLTKIESTIRYHRPESTTKYKESLPTSGHDCCKGYDAMDSSIDCLLVSDANQKGLNVIPGPILPFWSNMFSYYRTEAFTHFPQQRIRAVRIDRPNERHNDDGWIVRDIVGGPTSNTVAKAPRQGAFDNIHIAPKMKLIDVAKITFRGPNDAKLPDAPGLTFPVDRSTMRLDDISMAPFCAHDCFHTHWRWGSEATAKWTLGWDATGPYKVAGAPMVPLNHDVDIWLRGKNKLTYHVTVAPSSGEYIMPGERQVMMYHGSAYAVGIAGAAQIYLARGAFSALAPPPWFLDADDKLVTPLQSWALMYWSERFKAELVSAGMYEIKERTTIPDEGLKKAMDL